MPEPTPSARLAREAGQWLDDARAMLALLTRLPVAGGDPVLPRALRAMPLAGAAAGAFGGVVLIAALAIGLPPAVAALAAVAALVVVGGGLHEDGLADVADGFGGGDGPEEKLAIMRDSRIGSYGATALVLALLARVFLAAALIVPAGIIGAGLALVAAGALSRAGIVHVLAALPPARAEGLGQSAGAPDRTILWQALAAAGTVALITITPAIGVIALLCALAGAILATLAVTALARRQIGGQTGDVCGAAQQAAEIAVLAGLAVAT